MYFLTYYSTFSTVYCNIAIPHKCHFVTGTLIWFLVLFTLSYHISYLFADIVATIRVEPSVFLAFISKAVNNRCYNPYISGKISKRSFQKYMGCSIDSR